MKYVFFILVAASLAACTTEQKAPESNWQVKVSKEGEQKIWVWKHDGSKQCDAPSTMSPKRAAQDLKNVGVMVYQFKTGHDGMMYPSVCGAGTGATIELEISRKDLSRALKSGYAAKLSQN